MKTVYVATKNGRRYHASGNHIAQQAPRYEFDSLADAGMVRITSAGEENVYFEWSDDAGNIHDGFCKSL